MADIVDEVRRIVALRGDTYSSYEVLGALERAAAEIERLRSALKGLLVSYAANYDSGPDGRFLHSEEPEYQAARALLNEQEGSHG